MEQSADLLGGHRPAVRPGCCVESSQGLQRIRGQIPALDAPITESPYGLGIVGEGFAGSLQGLQLAQSPFHPRQDTVQVC